MANKKNNPGFVELLIFTDGKYVPIAVAGNVNIGSGVIVSDDYILSYSEIEKEPYSDN